MKALLKFLYRVFRLPVPPELDAPVVAPAPAPAPTPAPPVAPALTPEQAVARAKVELLREQLERENLEAARKAKETAEAAIAAQEAAERKAAFEAKERELERLEAAKLYTKPAPVVVAPEPIKEVTATVMTQCASSYASAQVLRDALTRGTYGYAVILDEKSFWVGFGPAEYFWTQPDGSVAMIKPPVTMAPPVVAPAAPSASRAQPLEQYPDKAALEADFAHLKLNTAVLLDGVVVVDGFGPPFKYFTKPDGSAVRT
jgi:hypothetical protein